MPEYQVTWEIDVDAPDAQAAAVKALAIQRNPEKHRDRVRRRAARRRPRRALDLTPDAD